MGVWASSISGRGELKSAAKSRGHCAEARPQPRGLG